MRIADRKEVCRAFHVALWLLLLLLLTSAALAERLPIKTYTTADGLPRDHILRIVQDSRGFLWFCTTEGLSRFDGYSFVNYSIDQGLPSRHINDFLESRSGVYWVATDKGLCRFNPEASLQEDKRTQGAAQRFVIYDPGEKAQDRNINVICEDHTGVIWCGTDGGLFRLDQTGDQWKFSFVDILQPATIPDLKLRVRAIIEDRRGSLWISAESGLYRRRPDGVVEVYTPKDGLPTQGSLLEDRGGWIWAGTVRGLYQLVADPQPGRPIVERVFTVKDGLVSNPIHSLCQSSSGKLWVGAGMGLSELLPASSTGGQRFQSYTAMNGLSDPVIIALAEDHDGNLWLGTPNGGAMRLAGNGFASYKPTNERREVGVSAIFEDRAGELYAMTGNDHLDRFDGSKFTGVPLTLPRGMTYWGWGWYQTTFQDSRGEWWLATGQGLMRYPKLTRVQQLGNVRPKAVYTIRDGLPANEIFRLFEDSRGDIWVSTLGDPKGVLTRWERATEQFRRYTPDDGIPEAAPSAFCEDAAGNIWIGLYIGGLLRYSQGRFTAFTPADGVPTGFIGGLYLDHANRLWVAAAEGGVARVDDPASAHPSFFTYSAANGLATNQGICITEDQWGMIYIGTGRGVDKLDPATGHIRHFTTADGLASSYVNVAFRQRDGSLWFGTQQGLSRFIPQPERTAAPPSIVISTLRIAGVDYPLSDLGTARVAVPELNAGQNNIQIEFAGLNLAAGESLRYEYQFEGVSTEWSAPTTQRAVSYANLAPGDYQFRVRAINSDGVVSETPALVSFRILSPVWRRWWFVATITLIIVAVIAAFMRSRLIRQRAIRESERRFRTLAETASDAIVTISEDGQIIFVNQATENIFGHAQEKMLGAPLTMLMPEYSHRLHETSLAPDKAPDRQPTFSTSIELPGLHRSGAEIPVELSFGEFTRDGRRYFTGIIRDITERKRHEAERLEAAEALQHSRDERLRDLEQVRRRIATDLHDDIGSSLTQIAILSEVAQQRIDGRESQLSAPLSMIAGASRELVDAMGDIVWAINPQKDHLSDLTQRMRRFASDVLTARNIAFTFREPDEDEDVQLGASIRREVFLIFKESVNNLVRHSHCTAAEIDFQIAAETLNLKVSDNGKGFDTSQQSDGHGLLSMRQRAEGVGGKLEMVSRPREGTTVTLELPLARQA